MGLTIVQKVDLCLYLNFVIHKETQLFYKNVYQLKSSDHIFIGIYKESP